MEKLLGLQRLKLFGLFKPIRIDMNEALKSTQRYWVGVHKNKGWTMHYFLYAKLPGKPASGRLLVGLPNGLQR